MSIFSDNIKLLRNKEELPQQKLAVQLIISRERLAKYEDGRSEPSYEVLKRISDRFHVNINVLLSVELSKTSLESLIKLEDNRILFPITLDKHGKDNIEIVPVKAKAGYLNSYADREFIESLQQMQIPFIGAGKHRAFPIEGDSMPPNGAGTFIVGRYVESLKDVKNGRTYVILSRDEGIIYKRAYHKNKSDEVLLLHSDNPDYPPYEIRTKDILEIWEYVMNFCMKEPLPDDYKHESLSAMFQQIRLEIHNIKDILNT